MTKYIWKKLTEDFEDVSDYVSAQAEMFYLLKIRKPLLEEQRQYVRNLGVQSHVKMFRLFVD